MRKRHILARWAGITFLGILASTPTHAEEARSASPPAIVQFSTIKALMAGVFESEKTVQDLKEYGDFAIGTFNGLDGELIGLEGKFYQAQAQGKIVHAADMQRTPFATTIFFAPSVTATLPTHLSLVALQQWLNHAVIRNFSYPYAIRIDGYFATITLSSTRKYTPPYPTPEQAVEEQSLYAFTHIEGTLVGFFFPPSFGYTNIPYYHWHFISKDRTKGGHVLDAMIEHGKASLQQARAINIQLPAHPLFHALMSPHS